MWEQSHTRRRIRKRLEERAEVQISIRFEGIEQLVQIRTGVEHRRAVHLGGQVDRWYRLSGEALQEFCLQGRCGLGILADHSEQLRRLGYKEYSFDSFVVRKSRVVDELHAYQIWLAPSLCLYVQP